MNTREVTVMIYAHLLFRPKQYNYIECVSSFVKLMKLLIFIDNAIIDYGYIDMYNTDITF